METISTTLSTNISYLKMRYLFDLLYKLDISYPYCSIDDNDYKGWKNWNNKYTPPDKRGNKSP